MAVDSSGLTSLQQQLVSAKLHNATKQVWGDFAEQDVGRNMHNAGSIATAFLDVISASSPLLMHLSC